MGYPWPTRCPWAARGLCVGSPWAAHGLSVGSPWVAHVLFVGCPWVDSAVPLTCPLAARRFSVSRSWAARGFCVGCQWAVVQGCPWDVRGVSSAPVSVGVHGLSVGCPVGRPWAAHVFPMWAVRGMPVGSSWDAHHE